MEECLSPTPFNFKFPFFLLKNLLVCLLRENNKKRRVRETKSVAMERHKCKLCSRTFGNGRALGGHMKAHLAIAKSQQKQFTQPDSFSSSESEEDEGEEKALINYVLRENPKKSLKVADPEFSFVRETESVIVQDRESETESKNNPTRQQRSKRNRKHNNNQDFLQQKKPKPSFMVPTTPSQFTEQEPVSSVSDTSPEEDVAMCLMMLSRDKWSRKMNNINNVEQEEEEEEEEGSVEKISKVKLLKRVRGKHLCENCEKTFRSSRALGSHKSICCRDEAKNGNGNGNDDKIFECPFCFKVFGSGQALGGHKRSHLMIPSSSTSTANVIVNVNPSAARFKESFIDLNMPAPLEEDDDLSVVSDA